MRFLRKVEVITRRDKIRNDTAKEKLRIKLVTEILEESQVADIRSKNRREEQSRKT